MAKQLGLRNIVVAVLLVVAWLAVGGVGGKQVGGLSGLQKNDAVFLSSDVESVQASEQAKAFQGAAFPVLIIATKDKVNPADPAVAKVIGELPNQKLSHGGVVKDLLVGPVAPVPSKDGQALLISAPLNKEKIGDNVADESNLVRSTDAIRSGLQPLKDAGYDVKLTGPAGAVLDLTKAFAGIDGLLLWVALGVVFVILVLVYRSPFLPIAVLLSAVFGLAAAALVVYPVAKNGWLTISGQSQGILSILVVGAATDYALLFVARYREELHQHEQVWNALKASWRGTAAPIAASASTVIAGLLCLTLSDIAPIRSLGPITSLGIVGALLASLTFLPAVLLLAGRKIFWPRIPRFDHVDKQATGGWAKLATVVDKKPRAIWMITAAGLAICALGTFTFKADGLSYVDVFTNKPESVQGTQLINKHFPDGSGGSLSVVVPAAKTAEVTKAIQGVSGVRAVVPSLDMTKRPPAPKVIDGKQLLSISIDQTNDVSAASQKIARDVRSAVHTIDSGLKVGGSTAQAVDSFDASVRDTWVVFPAILTVVFLVLVLLLRSLVAPLLLVLANVLSFLATLGISALLFNYVLKYPNSEPSTPLYAFVFLIALGIDYSIFLMTRIREEAPALGTRKAALKGLAVTGGVITSAGIVLAATFSALFVIPLVFMGQIAFFVAFGVLLDTFVVRSLLVSGLVRDIGNPVWWPFKVGKPVAPAPAVDSEADAPASIDADPQDGPS